ncbi:biopolymer transport protein ExbB [Ancylobacter polymorphus]|uniref:Biopolymer transport protein ExbB n=2 Tax=Ancylobacter polymorphus TaxID=223390 RepID=A0ABU0BFA8_9HYPH|nr:tonB-system energizer ExbB [Ancylobacter polymorphus]MDQ0303712.1 biopolymer transport protein ExbB [Ancylobacter polymorphus]
MPTTPKTTALRRALNLVLALAMLAAGPVGAWAQESAPASPALSAPPAATTPSAPTFDPLVPPASGSTAATTGGAAVPPPAGEAAAPSPAGEAAPVAAAPSAAAPSVAAPATGDTAADPAAGLPLEAGEDASVAAQLPHDLSPWGMFMAADWVVKAVMIGLAFASVVTWTVWLAKTMELMVAKGRLRRALKGYLASATLEEARRADPRGPAGAMLRATDLELKRSGPLPADGIKERVSISLTRIEVAAGRAITRGTGLLATIGATAPFVGLFGTVWGIMNSFIGISKAQTTNLAVVAPGIAEALLATAIGLVAAIPAVVIYNHFSRQVSGYRVLMGDASAEVLRLLSRDLDRRDAARAAPQRVRAAAE